VQSQAATGVSLAVGANTSAPTASETPVAAVTWEVDAAAVPYAIASVALELCYFVLLASAYQRGPLSVVYPVARGAAPVLVAGVSTLFLGVSLSAPQVLGILVVAGGIVLVRGFDRETRPGDLAIALATACAIAAYTLVDKQALEHADPLPYLELVIAPTAAIYLAATVRVAGADTVRRAFGAGAAVAGVGMLAAYALTLAALERVARVRASGAAVVFAGVVLLALT